MRSPTSMTSSRSRCSTIDELGELFGVQIDDEDVETVGGLMAKHLGRVPIPGAEVVCEGLRFRAESLAGRRNKIVTVVVSSVDAGTDDGAESLSVERAPDGSEVSGHV